MPPLRAKLSIKGVKEVQHILSCVCDVSVSVVDRPAEFKSSLQAARMLRPGLRRLQAASPLPGADSQMQRVSESCLSTRHRGRAQETSVEFELPGARHRAVSRHDRAMPS